MAKKKLPNTSLVSKILLTIVFLTIGFIIGMMSVKNKQQVLIVENKTTLSEPALLANEFYKNYIDCWNKTVGKKPYSEWDCDSSITTKYFTEELIKSMNGRTKAYCGYEPPESIYVTEGKQNGNSADVIVWGKYVADIPSIIHLTKKTNWQIDRIVCDK